MKTDNTRIRYGPLTLLAAPEAVSRITTYLIIRLEDVAIVGRRWGTGKSWECIHLVQS